MKLLGVLMIMCVIAGCAEVPEKGKPAVVSAGPATETISGTVTRIPKGMGRLELQTPGGWSQFVVADSERKELAHLTVGEKVDVAVQVQGGERKIVSVLRRNPPPAPTASMESIMKVRTE
jgi:hypothetical protein